MFNKTLSGTLLISGTAIGAGMLGIPLVTAKAGFLPALGITAAVWLFMLATGYLYLEAALWMPEGSNVLSISRRFLGRSGRLFAGGMYLFLYYCLMIAYFAGGAPIFIDLLKNGLGLAPTGVWGYLSYGVVFGGIVVFGLKFVDRINYLLMTAMFLAYFALVGGGTAAISWERFGKRDWGEALFAAPILFSAFGYHNVIPSLVTYFDRNVKILRRSIFWGTLIPFAVFAVWQWLIIGAVPLSAIEGALAQGMPATQALQSLTGYPWIMQMGQFFAFFALVTSMLGVAFSMVDFLGDGLKWRPIGAKRIILCAAVFLPPFVLSVLDPSIFVLAIGFAGGFGEAFLNGLLPVAIVWAGRYVKRAEGREQLAGGKEMLAILFLLGLSVVALEAIFLAQSFFAT
jgi:tyrosine-specific transport protein